MSIPQIIRMRRTVEEIFTSLGLYYTRRAYQMFPSSFWKLVRILRPIMERDTAGSEWQGSAWNGVITASQ